MVQPPRNSVQPSRNLVQIVQPTHRPRLSAGVSILLMLFCLLASVPPLAAQEGVLSPEARRAHEMISNGAARVLGEFFIAGGVPASVQGENVEISGHVLTFDGRLETSIESEEETVVGILVRISLDGVPQPRLRLGAIGAGANGDAAIERAIFDWAQLLGPGVLVVADRGVSLPQEVPFEGYRLYSGNTLLRGEVPEGFAGASRGVQERILDQLRPSLGEPEAGAAYTTFLLTLAVDEKRGALAECHLDGEKNEELCAGILSLPWPMSDNGYMLKQFYLFIPAE